MRIFGAISSTFRKNAHESLERNEGFSQRVKDCPDRFSCIYTMWRGIFLLPLPEGRASVTRLRRAGDIGSGIVAALVSIAPLGELRAGGCDDRAFDDFRRDRHRRRSRVGRFRESHAGRARARRSQATKAGSASRLARPRRRLPRLAVVRLAGSHRAHFAREEHFVASKALARTI